MKNVFRALAILAGVLGLAGCETLLGLGGETVENEAGPEAIRGGDARDAESPEAGDAGDAESREAGDAGDAESPEAGTDGGEEADSPAGGDVEDGPVVLPPSCARGGPGMTDCTSGDSGPESCCTSLEVEGGTYYRTYTNYGSGATDPADAATVSGFRLDKYDVTVGRFRQFVTAWTGDGSGAGGWTPAAGSGIHTQLNDGRGLVSAGATSADGGVVYETGWVTADNIHIAPTTAMLVGSDPSDYMYATWTSIKSRNEQLPINNENWYEAYAFCIWDGGFLPSEAEWEYAAAGGNQQLEFPWGSAQPDGANAWEYVIYNCDYPNSSTSGPPSCVSATIAPVGTAWLGAGLWGQLDLVGNVWQWTLDWYPSYGDPCVDCADLTAADDKWIRGGAFQSSDTSFITPPNTNGGNVPPDFRNYGIGFRCARTP